MSPTAPELTGPVLMDQQWRDLTFVHWAVEPQRLRRFMPAGCEPDTFEGRSYVGLVPFRMVGAGPGRGHPVPWLGTFLETNVRLYSVDARGRRGVVFLSLDTDRLLVVAGARAAFAVPYRWARMRHRRDEVDGAEQHTYDARLRWPGARGGSHLVVRVGPRRTPTPLDHFLSARWRLHTRLLGRTRLVPNAHGPWPLHDATLVELHDGLVRSVGLGDLAERPPDHVMFSPGVRTSFGLPRRH